MHHPWGYRTSDLLSTSPRCDILARSPEAPVAAGSPSPTSVSTSLDLEAR